MSPELSLVPLPARPPEPTLLLAAVLRQHQFAWSRLSGWIHPSWAATLGLPALGAQPSQARRQAHARALIAALNLPPVSVLALVDWAALQPDPGAPVTASARARLRPDVLALLPPAPLRRVLLIRALLCRRRWLRQQLQPDLWHAVRRWTGAAAFQALMQDAQDTPEQLGALPLAEPTRSLPDQLAWEGYCLTVRDGLWRTPAWQPWLRLRFAASASPPPLLPDPDPEACAWMMQRLDQWVPEWPWLSG